jgi:glycosyltransferase involved in cell wall biosynthesis
MGMHVVLRDFAAAAANRKSSFEFRVAQLAPGRDSPGVINGARGGPSTIDVRSVLQTPSLIDVWHDLGFYPTRSFAVRRQAGGNYPITLTHHSLSYKQLVQESYLPLLLQRPRSTDTIVCSSSAARDALSRILEYVAAEFGEAYGIDLRFGGRLEVIPLGVDTNRYRPLERAVCRAGLQIPEDAFVLLWTGRLSAIDKADLLPLLRVLGSLRTSNPGRKPILVCAGSEYVEEAYSETLRTFAGEWGLTEAVRILRNPIEITPELYGCADVFVSPVDSLQESFGLAPVEAMACGIPQVVSDWNGYRDTVVDGRTGFRIPTLWASCATDLVEHWFLHEDVWEHAVLGQSVAVDMEALKLRIQQLIDSPRLRQAMAAESRARAVELFDWTAVLAKHEDLWLELLRERSEEPQRPVFDLGKMPYVDIFGHYATHALNGTEELSLTSSAKDSLGASAALPKGLAGFIQPELLSELLGRLHQVSENHETSTAGALIGAMCQSYGLSPWIALRHLLWLIKHGWVSTSVTASWLAGVSEIRTP